MTQSLYQDHFGIRENPFSIIPDPHYLYMSRRHQDALAHLLYGVSESGGFVLLTGEVGTGKTTICRALIEQLPDNVELALILNPRLSETELMAAICDEFRIAYPRGTKSLKNFFDFLNRSLLTQHARGKNPVLMIDEAQNLSAEGLELVRLLTNLETQEKKLLQIILVGQPELAHTLAQPAQRQTAQRITARYHLDPLGLSETRNYIRHRLHVAGLDKSVFPPPAVKVVHRSARGIPRLINSICDRALLAAYVEGRRAVSPRLAKAAAAEVLGTQKLNSGRSVWTSLAAVLILTAAMFWVGLHPGAQPVRDAVPFLFEPTPTRTPEPEPQPEPEPEPEPEPAPKPKQDDDPAPPPEPEPNPADAPAPPTPETDGAVAVAEPAPVARDGEDLSRAEGTALGALLDSATPDRAFAELFDLWELDYFRLKGLTPCDKAEGAGLNCRRGETDLTGLKAMNRPAVISFVMPDGEHVYGVIRAVETTPGGDPWRVRIAFPDRDMTLDVRAFTLRWPGDYLVMWRTPAPIARTLVFGQEGPDVRLLRRLLAEAGFPDGETDIAGEGSVFFGPSLRERVRVFQEAYGLNADGIVGPETLLRLTGVAGRADVPTLSGAGE